MPLELFNTLSAQGRGVSSAGRQPGPHVRLRADGLRLRPHRQFPHVHRGRHAAPLSEAERLSAEARHEHHRRGRQDHSQRGARRRNGAGIHQEISPGVSGGCRRAEHRASRTVGECHRSHPGDGALHRRPGGARVMRIAPTMARITSVSPSFPSTASCRRRILPA